MSTPVAELTEPQRRLLNRLLLAGGGVTLNSRSRQQVTALEAAGLAIASWDGGVITVVPRLPGTGSYGSPLRIDRDLLDLSQLRAHIRAREWHGNSATPGVPRSNIHLAGWHARQHQRYHCTHVHEGPFVLVLRTGRGPSANRPCPLGWFTGQQPVTREDLDRRRAARLSGRPENH